MDTEIEERYVFYRFSVGDFEEALLTLDHLEKTDHSPMIIAIIKSAIISYGRPFSGNNALHRKKKWRLMEDFVPSECLPEHGRVMEARNSIVAHKDIPKFNPLLGKVGNSYWIKQRATSLEGYLEVAHDIGVCARLLVVKLWSLIREYEEEHFNKAKQARTP